MVEVFSLRVAALCQVHLLVHYTILDLLKWAFWKERANEFLTSSFLSLFFLPDEAGAYKTLIYVLVFASHELTSQLNNDTHTWRIHCLYYD